ncbi:NHL repeat-containing protein 3 isoform X1 [Sceloporus undulatus]|uniref:NHL repeat-containing protein 3 isoform X1 n=1 Tax=Sceloporus undulatus TaxID=8520 RepID=UPI001C4B59C8|nr:NHL repeat-containing protein 3 isoform X1 [Sceloporus undulatus]
MGVSGLKLVAVLGGASLLLGLLACYKAGSEPQVFNQLNFQSFRRRDKPLYKLDINWPKSPEKLTGQTFCVAVDHIKELVYIGQRGGDDVPKVVVYDEEGYFLKAWNTTIEMPHGMFALNTLNASSIWITDVGTGENGHTVKQYSPSGELLQVIGTPGKAGSGTNPLQFDQPAEIFVEETGDIYIVDGDGGMNNRLLKVTPDLKTLWLHGEEGSAITQFRIPHSVTVDSVGRVWVADRANQRIQVFDKITGEWLGSWSSCFTQDGPYSVRLTPDGKYVIVLHLNIGTISILAAPPIGLIGDCVVVDTIQLANKVKPHLMDINKQTGAIYVAEIGAQQVQRYVPLN